VEDVLGLGQYVGVKLEGCLGYWTEERFWDTKLVKGSLRVDGERSSEDDPPDYAGDDKWFYGVFLRV
jgi:hypothetical protein